MVFGPSIDNAKSVLFSGERSSWVLTDFGLTSAPYIQRSAPGTGEGTSGYRAPEVMTDEVHFDTKNDIFSLGCLLYEVVTRQRLFESDMGVLHYICTLASTCAFAP